MIAWLAQASGPLAAGLWVTLKLTVLSVLLGGSLAVPLALARLAEAPLLRAGALAWSGFFRGTPLLVQLFLVYYGLPQFGWIRHSVLWLVLRDGFSCALLTLTLNTSAYVSEVVRGGILAVPRGEIEAARALGMGRALLYRRIVLPRALRIMLPALGNEAVVQLKSTALVSTVTVLDLTGVARTMANRSYTVEPLIVAGAIYVVLTFGLAGLFRWAERRLGATFRA